MRLLLSLSSYSLGLCLRCRLVPSCLVIFDLEPLSLSFDFVFCSEIFNIFLVCLDRLCHLVILCLDQHAHTLHHLESLLTISLNKLDILEEDLEYKSLRNWREGFAAALSVLVTEASQSRQHESSKSPTAELFDVDSGRISIFTVNTKEYHSDVLA
ncbi:hypothetical protein Tco_1413166 [Tanacetum coccineum]